MTTLGEDWKKTFCFEDTCNQQNDNKRQKTWPISLFPNQLSFPMREILLAAEHRDDEDQKDQFKFDRWELPHSMSNKWLAATESIRDILEIEVQPPNSKQEMSMSKKAAGFAQNRKVNLRLRISKWSVSVGKHETLSIVRRTPTLTTAQAQLLPLQYAELTTGSQQCFELHLVHITRRRLTPHHRINKLEEVKLEHCKKISASQMNMEKWIEEIYLDSTCSMNKASDKLKESENILTKNHKIVEVDKLKKRKLPLLAGDGSRSEHFTGLDFWQAANHEDERMKNSRFSPSSNGLLQQVFRVQIQSRLLGFLSFISQIPVVAALEFGDDFTNNVFSDLAPILALFGEQVSKQFMAGSTTWEDNIIFAMAPLGIITAIVGAIRLGGPQWLKAIIGRARENKAAAEVELTTSTSKDVCELWNGSAIVRMMGSAKVVQLVYCEELSDVAPHFGLFRLGNDEEDVFVVDSDGSDEDIDTRKTDTEVPPLSAEEVATKSKDFEPNISLNLRPLTKRDRWELRIFAVIGTILQLAVLAFSGYATYGSKYLKEGKQVENYAYPLAAGGTILLVMGMWICSFVVERSTVETAWSIPVSIGNESPNPQESANQMGAGGLNETATGPLPTIDQADFSRDKKKTAGKRSFQTIWIQQGGGVNDQTFDSYVLFGRGTREMVITSELSTEQTPRDESTSKDHSTSCTTSSSIGATTYQASTSTNNLVLIGTITALIGFIAQFTGLRGMHWSAAIAQLAATFLMLTIRSYIRRTLSLEPHSFKTLKGYELDWLATRLGTHSSFNGELESESGCHTDQSPASASNCACELRSERCYRFHTAGALDESVKRFKLNTSTLENIEARTGREESSFKLNPLQPGGLALRPQDTAADFKSPYAKRNLNLNVPVALTNSFRDVELDDKEREILRGLRHDFHKVSIAHKIMKIRERLGILTRWRGPTSETAITLARSMEAFINHPNLMKGLESEHKFSPNRLEKIRSTGRFIFIPQNEQMKPHSLFTQRYYQGDAYYIKDEPTMCDAMFWCIAADGTSLPLRSQTSSTTRERIYLSVRWDLKGKRWHISAAEMESILSLWIYSSHIDSAEQKFGQLRSLKKGRNHHNLRPTKERIPRVTPDWLSSGEDINGAKNSQYRNCRVLGPRGSERAELLRMWYLRTDLLPHDQEFFIYVDCDDQNTGGRLCTGVLPKVSLDLRHSYRKRRSFGSPFYFDSTGRFAPDRRLPNCRLGENRSEIGPEVLEEEDYLPGEIMLTTGDSFEKLFAQQLFASFVSIVLRDQFDDRDSLSKYDRLQDEALLSSDFRGNDFNKSASYYRDSELVQLSTGKLQTPLLSKIAEDVESVSKSTLGNSAEILLSITTQLILLDRMPSPAGALVEFAREGRCRAQLALNERTNNTMYPDWVTFTDEEVLRLQIDVPEMERFRARIPDCLNLVASLECLGKADLYSGISAGAAGILFEELQWMRDCYWMHRTAMTPGAPVKAASFDHCQTLPTAHDVCEEFVEFYANKIHTDHRSVRVLKTLQTRSDPTISSYYQNYTEIYRLQNRGMLAISQKVGMSELHEKITVSAVSTKLEDICLPALKGSKIQKLLDPMVRMLKTGNLIEFKKEIREYYGVIYRFESYTEHDTLGWTFLHYIAAFLDENVKNFSAIVAFTRSRYQGRPLQDIEPEDCAGGTPLHYASTEAMAAMLIKAGANVNYQSEPLRVAPLHSAARSGNFTLLRYLLDHEANIDTVDCCGRTPLHWAALVGHRDVVKELIQRGAKLQLRDLYHRSILHYAVLAERLDSEILRFITVSDESHYQWQTHERPSLFAYSYFGPLAEGLFTPYEERRSEDSSYAKLSSDIMRPLHLAARVGNLTAEAVPFLYTREIDMISDSIFDSRVGYTTALHQAAMFGDNGKVARVLLDVCKCEANCKDAWGRTPLSMAVSGLNYKLVELLCSDDYKDRVDINFEGEMRHDFKPEDPEVQFYSEKVNFLRNRSQALIHALVFIPSCWIRGYDQHSGWQYYIQIRATQPMESATYVFFHLATPPEVPSSFQYLTKEEALKRRERILDSLLQRDDIDVNLLAIDPLPSGPSPKPGITALDKAILFNDSLLITKLLRLAGSSIDLCPHVIRQSFTNGPSESPHEFTMRTFSAQAQAARADADPKRVYHKGRREDPLFDSGFGEEPHTVLLAAFNIDFALYICDGRPFKDFDQTMYDEEEAATIKIIHLLIERSDVDVNFQLQSNGLNALMIAARYAFFNQFVEPLLGRKDIDVTLRNKEGKTAEDLAVEKGHDEVAALFSRYQIPPLAEESEKSEES